MKILNEIVIFVKKNIMENEIWKDIEGYESIYQVSNLGRVKSLERYVNHRKLKEKILKPEYFKGYLRVTLRKKHIFIHRLVGTAFIKNTHKKPYINHINGIKDDNRVENIEWCTASENQIHLRDVLGYKMSEETREKITINSKNMSEETKLKLSIAGKGRKFSEQHKQNMRKPKSENAKQNMRKQKSEIHKEKLKLAWIKRKNNNN